MSRFETEVLAHEENLEGLARPTTQCVDRAMQHTPHRRIILGMDSSESPVHGHQEGAAYNGHFASVWYHHLFLFNEYGDCEGALLRPGNVHRAERWRELLEPTVERYQGRGGGCSSGATPPSRSWRYTDIRSPAGLATPSGCPRILSCRNRLRVC